MYNGHVVSWTCRFRRETKFLAANHVHRSCPSLGRLVARPHSRPPPCPLHPAAQVRLALKAQRKHQSPLVTRLLFCLPTMTSLRPKEPCRPRNHLAVLPEKTLPHLRRHRSTLATCSKYHPTKKASLKSPLRANGPKRLRRQTRISNAPSRGYRRSVLRFVVFPILNDPIGAQAIGTTARINLSGGRGAQARWFPQRCKHFLALSLSSF